MEYLDVDNFLTGQLELYKITFQETSNNKYLEVMNNLYGSLNYIRQQQKLLERLARENNKLKNDR